jgi:O-antigen/teichoic acid export membrane protein
MPLRTALDLANNFSSLAYSLSGAVCLALVIYRKFRNDGKSSRQRLLDIATSLFGVSVVCLLADFLVNTPIRNDQATPAPLLLPIALTLVPVIITLALFGRGVGRFAIIAANLSIVLFVATLIFLFDHIDQLGPPTMY